MNKKEKITRISLKEAKKRFGKSRLMRLLSEQKKEMPRASK